MSAHDHPTPLQVQQKWDRRYQSATRLPQAAHVLLENQHLLPLAGRALDLACGLGGNALCLATHGLDTWAWDLSPVAVERLQATAQQRALMLHAEVRGVMAHPPAPGHFDVIVVSRFLERRLAPLLIRALQPGRYSACSLPCPLTRLRSCLWATSMPCCPGAAPSNGYAITLARRPARAAFQGAGRCCLWIASGCVNPVGVCGACGRTAHPWPAWHQTMCPYALR